MRAWPSLDKTFFDTDTTRLARALLGQMLVRQVQGTLRVGRIVETEAYLGPKDLACHTARGRTARTEPMFGPRGQSYVYFVYGMHYCFNVVSGDGEAVLIRALEPLHGLDGLRTDGPARLCKALGIDKRFNAKPLDGAPLWISPGDPVRRIARGPRIGVDYAGVWATRPLRFWDPESIHVSRPPRSK
jgi:DNA-3-methyladenine glycosylase